MNGAHSDLTGRVDPSLVPRRVLAGGASVPAIGLGTFSNDRHSSEHVAAAVARAIGIGYRLIDCAAAYGNEPEIGRVLEQAIENGVPREDLWITSKLWNTEHAPERVLPALRRTLSDLRVDYLDIYYIHWPFPNTHAPGASGDSRSPDARPHDPAAYLAIYRELEQAVDLGLVRHIGTSNMTVPKLEALLPRVRIRPAVNQMEMHPCFAQEEFFTYLRRQDMWPVAYCPLGSPVRPARDTDPADPVVMRHPALVRLAEARGVHPAAVCLKWAVARGQIPIPSSVSGPEMLANLRAVTEEPLTREEMAAVDRADTACRLIKGQVFLWEGAKSWRDLWDEDGVIVS